MTGAMTDLVEGYAATSGAASSSDFSPGCSGAVACWYAALNLTVDGAQTQIRVRFERRASNKVGFLE